MDNSLYEVLNPLVLENEIGVLNIHHEYGSEGTILLENGSIKGVFVDTSTGTTAAKVLASWVSISTEFVKGELPPSESFEDIDASDFLELLAEVDLRIKKIQSIVPGNEAVFRTIAKNLEGGKTFGSKELKIILALDGKRSIREIVSNLEISELEVLSYIYILTTRGLVEMVATYPPMEEDRRVRFLDSLQETLSELVGPAANVIINDAFSELGTVPELLAQRDIPGLMKSISLHLDEDEKAVFDKWGSIYLEEK